ncbi:NADP-dependent oxidoreductase [Frigoribacterium faeni]|uniref:Oxidoreductase n=1 Tax=Frigoribacterium faeni TaxID=145483 RepID=A0A7W3JJ92_9MICO|nr:NADP-dependent oxidoreductase [Frigoribacterium faeni]MBA8813891.1 NADPH:quinone reductase-like Zn-dependent oxidoreductase [Frigoribacterium faeni]BFF15219.1 NADP-dependent oxidoreductase [Microbacterium flavescens]GEK82133.1 putative oxidoreductase [Frigoribacterium faeni]
MSRSGKTVEFDRYGDVDELHFVPQEMPVPGDDEVVVEVVCAGLNHIENFIRLGDFADRLPLEFPARQGSCFAGIVKKRGSAVRDFSVGAEVIGHAIGGGAHATFVTVPASSIVTKPPHVSWEVAGGLYLAGVTAYDVVRSLHLGTGDVVVITAAAGGVGHIECQLALAAGAKVIGTCSPPNHDYLRSIGVTPITYGDGLQQRIEEAAGRPVTAFIDNFGGDNPDLAEALGVAPSRFSSSEHRLDLEVRYIRPERDDAEPAMILAALAKLIAENKVRVLISGFYPFDYIAQAFDDLAEKHSRGKVVVGMQPVETGARSHWYLSGKARSTHEASA